MISIMSLPQPNILQLAHQMADKMTKDDSVDLENMDMESMISHVTKNVMGMMPHPERAVDDLLGNIDGLDLFNSLLN